MASSLSGLVEHTVSALSNTVSALSTIAHWCINITEQQYFLELTGQNIQDTGSKKDVHALGCCVRP